MSLTIPAELWPILISAIFGAFKAFKFVHEGELGIKLRFGKALRDKQGKPRVIEPGFVFLVPWVDSLKRHHVRQETIRFDQQKIMIREGLIFNFNAIVMFRIKDIYRALFEIANLENSIEDLGMGILRDQLSLKQYDELSDTEKISEALLESIKLRAEEWGVDFIQFKLTSCAPTQESANLIVAKTGVKFRMEALKDAIGAADISDVSQGFLALLIGVPLVATTSIDAQKNKPRQPTPAASRSFIERVMGSGEAAETAIDS